MDKKSPKKKLTHHKKHSSIKHKKKDENGNKVVNNEKAKDEEQEKHIAKVEQVQNQHAEEKEEEEEEDDGTSITTKERQEIKAAFDVLDDNGDGKLNLQEMRTLLQSQFLTFTDAHAHEIFRELDEDNSGGIEFCEFEKYVIENKLCKPTPDEFGCEMRCAFEMFDSDHNGFIDAEEFKKIMTHFGDKLTDAEVQEMMRDADVNGDGKIDYREFCEYMSKNV